MKNKFRTQSKFFIFFNHQLLLIKNNDQYTLPDFNILAEKNILSIGLYNQCDCFVVDTQSEINLDESYVLVTLRFALENSGEQWQNVLSRAYQIMLWDLNHQFCGRCGEKTNFGAEKLEKRCEHCHLSFFPKISPAVIVLIKKNNQILMARKKDFSEGVYGLIAGFSEPGETLEETIHREVYEEVGLRVKNICYTGSQPWPFPDSLMISFTADYDSGEISLNDGELDEAAWYDINNLPGRPSSSISIAYKMIDDRQSELMTTPKG